MKCSWDPPSSPQLPKRKRRSICLPMSRQNLSHQRKQMNLTKMEGCVTYQKGDMATQQGGSATLRAPFQNPGNARGASPSSPVELASHKILPVDLAAPLITSVINHVSPVDHTLQTMKSSIDHTHSPMMSPADHAYRGLTPLQGCAPNRCREISKRKKKSRRGTGKRIDITKEEEEELPDLQMKVPLGCLYAPDDLVWVLKQGLLWPSFVLKVFPRRAKASVLLIHGHQQNKPLQVGLTRLKNFSYIDYTDIFETQKDKAVGLTEAMETASRYKTLKAASVLTEAPREFFCRTISDQQSILNRQTMALRGVSLNLESFGSPERNSKRKQEEEEGEVSENSLSEREKKKLASATKARRTSSARYIRFIRSDACLDHLRLICAGKIHSVRHQHFKEAYLDAGYLMHVHAIHNTGIDFFSHIDTEQTEDILSFLFSKFSKEEFIGLDLDSSQRKIYINTVLFPEAIKESLRIVKKIPDDDLEMALEKGLAETCTEKKARRLQFA